MKRAYELFAVIAVVLCGFASQASATAYYVYHDPAVTLTGGSCGTYRDTLTPTSASGVTVRFKVERQFDTNQVRLYYTTGFSVPGGAFGVGTGTTTVVTAAYTCTYDDGFGHIIDVATATIPAQPAGTIVNYIVSAWHSGGGPEVFANSGSCNTSTCAQDFAYVVTQPASVDLLDFAATRTAAGVQLTWQTGAESDCAAFTILRCDRGQGACAAAADHAELPGILVPCAGLAAGSSYATLDAAAADGGGYSYYLREHETTGGLRDYGPELVAPVVPGLGAPGVAKAAATGAATDRVRGCAAAGRPAGALLLLALVALLALARRRR
ncbi:MAG TPA: MYXO-CTERM sorting domain-containing protein [Polyangia bacterium]|jgi:uncharacterized protein (TIGR03382 family)